MDLDRFQKMVQKEKWEEAILLTNEAISIEQDSADAWLYRGVALYEFVRQNCRLFTTDSFAWLVVLFDKSGRMKYKARERVKSTMGNIHTSRLELLLDEAESSFTKSIEIKPKPVAYLWRGLLYRDTGRFEQAEKDFKQTLELDNSGLGDTTEYHLNALREFDWDKVGRLIMSEEIIHIPIEDRYGEEAINLVQNILKIRRIL